MVLWEGHDAASELRVAGRRVCCCTADVRQDGLLLQTFCLGAHLKTPG